MILHRRQQISMPIVKMVAIDLLDMAVLRLTLAPSQHHTPKGQEHGKKTAAAVTSTATCPPSSPKRGFEPHDSDGGRVSARERPRSRRPSATRPRMGTSPRRPIRPRRPSFRDKTTNRT